MLISGKAITKSNTEEIKYSLREQNYGAIIQKAYAFASKSLLELLLKEYDLMGRLKSVKNYFLMSQGDFIIQFMEATEQELSKKIDDIIPSKLESLLGLCLRYLICHIVHFVSFFFFLGAAVVISSNSVSMLRHALTSLYSFKICRM